MSLGRTRSGKDAIHYPVVYREDVSGYLRVFWEKGDMITLLVAANDALTETKVAADYVCDGTADEVQINAAITALPTAGGCVLLSEGQFNIAAPIQLDTLTVLGGAGQATVLYAVNSLDDNTVELSSVNEEWTTIRNLMIDGNKANQASGIGIYLDNTAGSFTYTDAHHFIYNVFVYNCKSHGIQLVADNRETQIISCKAYNNDGTGIYVIGDDCEVALCVAGLNGLRGFRISGAEARVVSCKGFGNGQITAASGDGFVVDGNGNMLCNCHAEDNVWTGFLVNSTNCTLEHCIANDNGTVGSRQPGFYIGASADRTQLMGCYAHDTRAAAARTQSYGAVLANGVDSVRLNLVTYNNFSGSISDGGAVNLTDESVAW